ncbi:MAG: AlkZ family DNA glycosylase [Candidatus Dormibacteraeota bacterium]|uniref:AlkZ family DNA glycosylase n=1 Tax=Candidatus Aeolococcus gillhamiae TaxID=3127015 RepID=A0A2W5ZAP9_9BACT|nr:AlkZ family DNA glycosylase [Candidatus Dormibacteraeota bacterium]PZR81087.1 MAG: winged helix DNA-binding domain-containing protein [Candidatus Dormibacter sp. RRmetagenome_bin12]
MDILQERLRSQHLLGPAPAAAADVVRHLVAVQSQDYPAARWAVAQRTADLTGADVDDALSSGSILRTHLLRPTWHLVTPDDIRWMLALTAPRVKALMAYGYRRSGVDDAMLAKSNRIVAAALHGGPLTRIELGDALWSEGIEPRVDNRLAHLMIGAELDGIVCSGPLRGKQHTYALLDEVVPPAPARDRATALAELASRYYASHGPATIKDFAWWSGLSTTEATTGTNTAQSQVECIELEGRTYWFAPTAHPTTGRLPTGHLLPDFDEYTVAYADRTHLIDAADLHHMPNRMDVISNNVLVVNGRVVGSWKRAVEKGTVRLTITPFEQLPKRAHAAVASAAERYAAFLQLPLHLEAQHSPSRSDARSMTNR